MSMLSTGVGMAWNRYGLSCNGAGSINSFITPNVRNNAQKIIMTKQNNFLLIKVFGYPLTEVSPEEKVCLFIYISLSYSDTEFM